MPKIKIWLMVCFLALTQSAAFEAMASVDSSNIISGFAKWNASRVEKIVLENALLKVADNRYVKKYFPSTAAVVETQYDIGITGLGALVKLAVESDLTRFEAAIYQCIPMNINAWQNSENLAELASKPKILFENLESVITSRKADNGISMADFMDKVCPTLEEKDYGLDNADKKLLPREAFKKLALKIEAMKLLVAKEGAELKNRYKQPEEFFASSYVQKLISKSKVLQTVFNSPEFSALLANNQNSATPLDLEAFLVSEDLEDLIKKKLDSNFALLVHMVEQNGALPRQLEDFMDTAYLLRVYQMVDEVFERIKLLKAALKNEEKLPYVVRAHQLISIIDEYSDIDERDFSGFHLVRKYSMFFASLADASNTENGAEAVAGVLEDFVDEQGTYRSKRANDAYALRYSPDRSKDTHRWQRACGTLLCENMLFVSSYFGLAFSRERTTDPVQGNYAYDYRPFGPVGIELKLLKLLKGNLLFNYSPIDIGTYINNELQEKSYEAKLDHIKSPSYFFSYTFNAYPAAVLVGYQKDITLAEQEHEKMESIFISLAFDLPVFTLY